MDFDRSIMSCIHCYSTTENNFTVLKYLFSTHLPPSSWATTDLFTAFLVFPFPECLIVAEGRGGVKAEGKKEEMEERNKRERLECRGRGKERGRSFSYKVTVLLD